MDSVFDKSGQDVGLATSSAQSEPLQDDIGLAMSQASSDETRDSLSDYNGHVNPRQEVRRVVGECQNSSSLPRQGMTNSGHPSATIRQGSAVTNTWDAKGPARKIFPVRTASST